MFKVTNIMLDNSVHQKVNANQTEVTCKIYR
jgi:hypothetical protein